jgi:CotH kinase protein
MAGSTRLGRTAALGCALLCLLMFAASAAAVEEDPAAPMYQPYAIDVIDLQLPQASIETLEAEPEDHYVEGTFSMAESDGSPSGVGPFTTPIAVGVRLKGGNGSFRELKDEKAAFKIKFNQVKGQKFNGLKKLTLNNMVQDPSMLHETLAYEAFRSLGVPAPRTGYANVYVNGVNYGLHLDVETYDDVSLPHWFGSTQHLYEADAPGVDVSGSAADFEVDEGDEEDRADLEALIVAAKSGVGDWSDGMAGLADLDEMTRMWAVERYAGHWDGYAGVQAPFRPNNYFLHSDESGLFSMLPWGTDQTWELDVEFDEPAGGILFNECFADESCSAMYVDALRKAQSSIGALDLRSQVGCLAERLVPWQALEDEGRREFGPEEIEEGVDALDDFLTARPGELTSFLSTQPGGNEVPPETGTPAPCGPPEPESESPRASADSFAPSGLAAPPFSGPLIRHLRFAVDGASLSAKLRVEQPGLLIVNAWMPTHHGMRRVCGRRRSVTVARQLTVRCYFSGALRRRLHSRRVPLRIGIRFRPAGGNVETIQRKVVLPRWQQRR